MAIYDIRRFYDYVQSDNGIEVLRNLLGAGVELNFQNLRGDTLLHAAAMSTEDNIEIIQELLNAGADADISNVFRYRPLHCAVINRKRRVVEELLQCRIDINSKDYCGKTALHYAVSDIQPQEVFFPDVPSETLVPDVRVVRKLLDHEDLNVDARDDFLDTPLMLAVGDNHLDIVKLLLNHGSNIVSYNKYEQTPLHISLSLGNPSPYILVLMLLKRPNIFKRNDDGDSILNLILERRLFIASICFKIIAFNYDIRQSVLKYLLKDSPVLPILCRYYEEINRMKSDIIANELTVFDFLVKRALQSGFSNPVSEIYEPIVERIITGLYPEYFCYILHRISKSNFLEVLKCVVGKKYCTQNRMYEKKCKDENCKKEHRNAFSEVFGIGLLSGYLESFDIFCLIVSFSSAEIDQSFLNFCHHECYLQDSWEVYPDDYF